MEWCPIYDGGDEEDPFLSLAQVGDVSIDVRFGNGNLGTESYLFNDVLLVASFPGLCTQLT